MNNLITIIVPVYMLEKYLPRCIDSILKQTYENFELILVDDGSTDASGAICDEYGKRDARIKVLHQANSGVSVARNRALDIAKGTYITFIDGDDFVEKHYLQQLLSVMKKSDADISYVERRFYYEDKQKYSKRFATKEYEVVDSKTAMEKLLSLSLRQSVWGALFTRKLVEDIRFIEGLAYAEDWEYVVNAFLRAEHIAFNASTLYTYSIREGSAMTKPFSDKYLAEIDILDDMMDSIVRKYPEYEALSRARKLHSYFGIIRLIEYDKDRYPDTDRWIDVEKDMIQEIKSNDQGLILNRYIGKGVKVKLISLYLGGPWLYAKVQKLGETIVNALNKKSI